MAVQFNEDKKIFRLDTETSTYLMGLTPEGYLGHIYYGDRLYKATENYMLRMEEPPYTGTADVSCVCRNLRLVKYNVQFCHFFLFLVFISRVSSIYLSIGQDPVNNSIYDISHPLRDVPDTGHCHRCTINGHCRCLSDR